LILVEVFRRLGMLRGEVLRVDLFQSAASLFAEGAVRVLFQEGLEGGLCVASVVKVVEVDCSFGEQSGGAVVAAGVFAAKEFVLADGVVEGLFFLEDASLLGEQVGDGEDAGVGFGRSGVVVVDGAEEVENAGVVAPAAVVFRARFEGLIGAFGAVVWRCRGCGWAGCVAWRVKQKEERED
jgi:hypothetical protein